MYSWLHFKWKETSKHAIATFPKAMGRLAINGKIAEAWVDGLMGQLPS